MDSTTQAFAILIILLATVLSIVFTQFIRRRPGVFKLRDIPAYNALPLMVGAAIEANRPIHLSLGNAGIGGENTALALTTAELFYEVTRRAAIGHTAPIVTSSDPTSVPLAQDTLRKAYQSRDLLDRYASSNVRWYPQGARSLAFAAALTAMMGDDNVGGSVLAGSFGPEIALVAGSSARRNTPLIATSNQLEGQAVAFAMADDPFIGEEIFTAGAYFNERASYVAGVVTQDYLRWLLILALIVLAILAAFDTQVGDVLDVFLGD